MVPPSVVVNDGMGGRRLAKSFSRGAATERLVNAPRSPWQNPYAERLVGSIRRECLDHVIIFGERHLRRFYRAIFNTIMTPDRRRPASARGFRGQPVRSLPIPSRL
jgi:hypothetical protein